MSESNTERPDDTPCQMEIVFDQSTPPDDCRTTGNRVRCAPVSHHADPLSIESGVTICKEFGYDEIKGSGMMRAGDIVQPANQLDSEFGDRVTGGLFADVMTPAHSAYPMTVFHGFRLVPAVDGFGFATSVGSKVENHFETADLVRTSHNRLTVITNTDQFSQRLLKSHTD
ncbi:hypothetical protein [Halohasta salina]|uniref:hypothetical protein n=1 Tax=Halohasta salina TaxID=2961621 RepID=UPI0020A35354|nr:hypothetical protein [Halohasta salina]